MAVKKKVLTDKATIVYQIAELKKDGLSLIIHSIAVSVLAFIVFIGAPSVFPTIINPYLPSSLKIMQGIVLVPVVVFVLTLIINFVRWIKIIKLSKLLKK